MCGRMNVVADPLTSMVSNMLGINFSAVTNTNLCPSENVSTIIKPTNSFSQINASWGIQPSWSKRLLINAQSETVNIKTTFKEAFATGRCLVPCSGWYEWRVENNRKVKYSFTHVNNEPFYMAGILYNPEAPQLVTLTTSPNEKCSQYHKRMPVLILPTQINNWFNSPTNELAPSMKPIHENIIGVVKI